MADSETKIREDLEIETEQRTDEPRLYRVILLNDDYTTMDFVVHILEKVFHMSTVEAIQIMLHVHQRGRGICGVFTREIAETKVEAVHDLARRNQFPLKCLMEKE